MQNEKYIYFYQNNEILQILVFRIIFSKILYALLAMLSLNNEFIYLIDLNHFLWLILLFHRF